MKPIISVRDLGKMYRIRSEEKKRYLTLRDELAEGFRKLWHGKLGQSQVEEFWALKDINFDVYPGEVVGIIGRNGAGKSTLLKILSRITPPTKGEAILGGRVGSLLEVGTGFHPELTGRENIYLSGAILGMSRAEIKRKFDEIVAFAEVERFIDTPVKRYSSGMYVRLAFGVAAHLEPEILIVDEVLAVGDAQFQKKCLGKMEDVAKKDNKTVIFVSHNMSAIQSLCTSGILIEKGFAQGKEKINEAIDRYSIQSDDSINNANFPVVSGEVIIHQLAITQNGFQVSEYESGKPITVTIHFEITEDLTLFRMGFFLKSILGESIFRSLIADWHPELETLTRGKYVCEAKIPENLLSSGTYIVELHSSIYGVKDYGFGDLVKEQLTVYFPSSYNAAHINEPSFGSVILNPSWNLQKIN